MSIFMASHKMRSQTAGHVSKCTLLEPLDNSNNNKDMQVAVAICGGLITSLCFRKKDDLKGTILSVN